MSTTTDMTTDFALPDDLSSRADMNTSLDLASPDMAPDLEVRPDMPDLGVEEDMSSPPTLYEVSTFDEEITYETMPPAGMSVMRTMSLRIRYPLEFEGAAPIILISHGGQGSLRGHTNFAHIGDELARHGYIAVHIGHRTSENVFQHRWDRPNDVRQVLDALVRGEIASPDDYRGTVDFDKVGHLGHSWGAYTAHAVAGALFENPLPREDERWNFRDERIDAIVTLSPQGWGQFGAFDEEENYEAISQDNSWQSVEVPVLSLIGEREMDGVAGVESNIPGTYRTENWRLIPFARYPSDGTRHACTLPGQTHVDLGGSADNAVNTHVALNARLFFDVYLNGKTSSREQIGMLAPFAPDVLCQSK